jgi:hypothetical protein
MKLETAAVYIEHTCKLGTRQLLYSVWYSEKSKKGGGEGGGGRGGGTAAWDEMVLKGGNVDGTENGGTVFVPPSPFHPRLPKSDEYIFQPSLITPIMLKPILNSENIL